MGLFMTALPFTEYDRLDATALARLIQSGQLRATDVCDAAVKRALMVNPSINAIVYPLYEAAQKQAEAFDASYSPERKLPAFFGIPFLIKDFGSQLGGVPHSSGNRALRDYIPAEDDEMVRRWKAAGIIPLGKSNTPEFALMGVTESKLFGPARNPWNLNRTPGGSSGGAAAAIAAGVVPIASAGDGGGSIRIPASCCGLFGLKPSRGRVPAGPSVGEPWQGASVEHALTRSVRDSAAMLDLVQGPDIGAPYILTPPTRPYREEMKYDPRPLRIGFSVSHPLGGTVHPDCQKAVYEAAKKLEDLGHTTENVLLPWDGPALAQAFLMLYFGETAASLSVVEKHLGRPVRPNDVEPISWLLGLLGRRFSAGEFVLARQSWNTHARAMGQFHQKYDLLLTPTIAVPPMQIGELQSRGVESAMLGLVQRVDVTDILRRTKMIDQLAFQSLEKTPFTQLANLTGQPAMSVPLHWSAGLPIGVQFVAPFGREDLLFSLAGQLERAHSWSRKRPPLNRSTETVVLMKPDFS